MTRSRHLKNAFWFVFLTGIGVATACGDEPEDGDGDGDDGNAGETTRGGATSGGSSGTGTGGNTAGESGDGGTTTGGRGGTSSTGGNAGEGGAGDGGQGADSGEGGTAGSAAGMSGGGMGGANGGMAGGGMAGGGMGGANGGMAGGGMAGGGMAGGGMAGGGMAGTGPVGCGTAAILDDMEDGNGGICPSNNRVGGWYVNKETGVGTIIPAVGTVVSPTLLVPPRTPSTRGMHFQGSGFTGADHWAYLATSVFDGAEGVPYNASVHTGIRFWAKSDGGSVTLNVKFNTVATSGTGVGGTCVPTTVPCDDHWQVARTLTGAWTQYSVNLGTDLSQLGWGVVAPKDLAHLRGIEFYFNSTTTVASFDFWIDDIEFW